MPRIAAPVQPGADQETEGRTAIHGALREAQNLLRTRAMAELLRPLGIGTGSEFSTESSVMKGLGEAVSGLASGMKGAMELHTLAQKALLESMGQQGKGGGDGMMTALLLLLLLDRKEERPQQQPDGPTWRDLIGLLEKRIDELESSRGPSPIDQQMHGLAMQLVGEAIQAKSRNPLEALTEHVEGLKALREVVPGLLGGGSPEYSEGALRAKALDKEIEAERNAHLRELAKIHSGERMWSQHIPRVAEALGKGVGQALAQFGLVQTGDGGGFSPEAMAAAESAAAARGGAE
jgi:hypothetical protein